MVYDVYYKQNDIEVRRSFPSDVEMLCNRLRQSDVDEVWASNNLTPWEALYESLTHSIVTFTITQKGLVLGMFGINPDSMLGNQAMIWFLASDDIDKIKLRFLRHSKRFVNLFLSMYPYLYNYVDIRNLQSMVWLSYCGAKFMPPMPHGLMRKEFRYFYFER